MIFWITFYESLLRKELKDLLDLNDYFGLREFELHGYVSDVKETLLEKRSYESMKGIHLFISVYRSEVKFLEDIPATKVLYMLLWRSSISLILHVI